MCDPPSRHIPSARRPAFNMFRIVRAIRAGAGVGAGLSTRAAGGGMTVTVGSHHPTAAAAMRRGTALAQYSTKGAILSHSYSSPPNASALSSPSSSSSSTIYQLSSGMGSGRSHSPAVGVAIIRISGPIAKQALLSLTRRQTMPKPRVATRANIYQPRLDLGDLMRHSHDADANVTPGDDSAKSTDADLDQLIDAGILVLYFPAPHSFTGEDVVELHVHGTPLIVSSVFDALQRINRAMVGYEIDGRAYTNDNQNELTDASSSASSSDLSRESAILSHPPLLRLAGPGEFTRRAFTNGKLDLTQVEALGDLLHAETERQKSQALVQMRGELGRFYSQWRQDLLHSLAYLEAVLDFSEDEQDVGESEIVANVLPKVRSVCASLRAHLSDHRRGELVRSGVEIVLVGAPNAGKSSLLNALAQRNVAIVSPVPGTTRDIVENRINIGGWACIVADTAGLRQIRKRQAQMTAEDGDGIACENDAAHSSDALLSGHDLIEAEGMERTHERTRSADIKLVLLDASQLLAPTANATIDPQVLNLIDASSIVVWTKMDLLVGSAASVSSAVPLSGSAAPSVSTAGRAKLRTAQQFYDDARDSFTTTQVEAFKQIAAQSTTYQQVAQRTPNMTFLACAPAKEGHAKGTNAKGVQQLLVAIENQIKKTVGVDSHTDSRSPSSSSSMPLITRQRHRVHVESCLVFLELFDSYMARGDLVLAAEQLRLATREIGKITGRIDVEELLDVIFEDFCIGK